MKSFSESCGESRRGFRGAIASVLTLAVVALQGCATYPASIAVGMTHDDVVATYGQPTYSRNFTDGSVMMYATGPMGQFTYSATLGLDGRVARVDQVLTVQNFARIQVDEWNRETVLAYFGPPAEKTALRGYPEVWNYRYREQNVFNSLMSVMFDANGIVRKYENGPDPMYDKGEGHSPR